MKFFYQKIVMIKILKNEQKIQNFEIFLHFPPFHAVKHHIKRSYFYRKLNSEQNKTNLKSLSQILREEIAFEVAKTKVFRRAIFLNMYTYDRGQLPSTRPQFWGTCIQLSCIIFSHMIKDIIRCLFKQKKENWIFFKF